MKKKIFIALGISFAIVLSITAIFLNVYGGTPTVKEGEVLVTLSNENLYKAIKVNLDIAGIEYKDCEKDGQFGSNNKGKGYLILKEENILLVENLNLAGCEISNISGLQKFTNLKVLNLANNSVSNVDVLKNTSLKDTLEALNLNNNKLDNNQIRELSVISNLKELYISGMEFSSNNNNNIEFINGFTDLTYLDISNNGFNDISSLSLTNLKYLNISSNEIDDISIINQDDKYAHLHTLVANYNLLDDNDVTTIKTRASLKALGLAGNKITKIGDLNYLTNLEELSISSNYITDTNLTGLENLSNLKTLNAGFIGISNLNKIKNLANIESLDISGNNIENIEDITNLTNLMYLDVSANKIGSISDETYNLLTKMNQVNLTNQIFSQSIEGLRGEEKEITLPSIFKKSYLLAKEDTEYSDETHFLISNVTFNEDKSKVTVNPYYIASSGGIVQIMDGPFMNSYLTITGTSVSYELDRTGKREINQDSGNEDAVEEYSRVYKLETELKNKLGIADLEHFDLNELFNFIGNKEGDTENNNSNDDEEENNTNKIIAEYMDFNTDGEIDESDYYRLYNYINGNIHFLYTTETIDSIKTNENLILELVSTDYEVEMDIENGIKTAENNGTYNLSYKKNGTTKTLSPKVTCIDKVAPTYAGPNYSTAEETTEPVTVTIIANEEIADIYSDVAKVKDEEDTEPDQDENGEANSDEKISLDGWVLAEDSKTITKAFKSNEEKTVVIQDLAGSTTEINVSVKNIIPKDSEDTGVLIIKYDNVNGEDYDVDSWTNKNIYLDIEEDAKGIAYYKINGGETKSVATTLTEDGEYTIELYNKDENGQEEVNTYKVKIDKTAPQAGDIEIYENDEDGRRLYNNDTTSEFIYVSLDNEDSENENADRTVFTIDGGEENSVSTIIEESGTHTIQVYTYDRAGNKVQGNKYTIRLD